ncbi:MAG: hypothetical protein KY466_06745 [Gemmatimonadetes bacterium]|nr:hypothetical protein [Gemmatimonadota bacterium]
MKIMAREKSEQNQAAIDPWTVVHLAAGLAAGLMNVPLAGAMAASVVYEVAEQFFERQRWGQELFATSGPESPPNAVVDTAVFLVGHVLGRLWNETGEAVAPG